MSDRQCAVCGRFVPQGYEQDHIRVNHLGPHVFWFDAVRYETMEPSMRVHEIKRLANAPLMYYFYEERDGRQIPFSDDHAVDLTNQPHFFCIPPAAI